MLTNEQRRVFDHIVNTKSNTLIIGPGGVGKSFLIQRLVEYMHSQFVKVGLCATTGVAAYNIGGSTLHRLLGIGLAKGEWEAIVKGMFKNKNLIMRLRSLDVIILDEVSMLGKSLFDKCDKILRCIRRKQKPWGGIQLVFSGDFLQLPPVNDDWVFESDKWDSYNFTVFPLENPMRFTDKKYFEMLMRIRDGIVTDKDDALLRSRVDAYLQLCMNDQTQIQPTVFYSTRKDVDTMNQIELRQLDGEMKLFVAQDAFGGLHPSRQSHYKNILDEMIPSQIQLKVHAQVMLKANLEPEAGLCNGSRGIVTRIEQEFVHVRFLSGRTELITPYVWEYEDSDAKIYRKQIPLVLAWSMTIHKCLEEYTWVMCENNLQQLKDIDVGTNVLTMNGYSPVTAKYTNEKQTLIEFTTHKGYTVCVAPLHRLLSGDDDEYHIAFELKVGNSLVIQPRPSESFAKRMWSYIYTDEEHLLPLPIKYNDQITHLTPNIAMLYGAWWVKECRPKGPLQYIESNSTVNDIFKNTFPSIKDTFTQFTKEYYTIGEYGDTLYVYSPKFEQLLFSLTIEMIMKSSVKVQRAFIQGMRASFHISKANFSFCSVDIERVRNVQRILLNIGYISTINDKESYYMLTYTSVVTALAINDTIVDKKVVFEPIKTYDITVDEEHHFVANGIISHNSQSCTLDYAIGDLGSSIFEDGQTYVLTSRVRNTEGLFLSDYQRSKIRANEKALAFVKKYRSKLQYQGEEMTFVDEDESEEE